MTNEYGLKATREKQKWQTDATELQNIQRLQKRIDAAKAELEEAHMKRWNRIMSQEGQEQ